METELTLIRHGHAVRVNGDYVRAPLTELGRKQAELTGMRFCAEQERFDGFYTSPLRRTKETSAIIGSKTEQIPDIKPGIQELEGIEVPLLVLFEFLARVGWFGGYLYNNVGKPLKWPIAGRVSTVISDLLKKHEGGKIAVVTHSGVISSVLAWYFPQKRRQYWVYVVDNCSLTRLRINGTRAELIIVNDSAHLSAALTTKQPPAATVEVAKQAEKKIEQAVPPQQVKDAAAKLGQSAPVQAVKDAAAKIEQSAPVQAAKDAAAKIEQAAPAPPAKDTASQNDESTPGSDANR